MEEPPGPWEEAPDRFQAQTREGVLSRGERELLDRMGAELDLLPAWQTANPGRRLAQTLRWVTNPVTPYHCDGVFIPRAWRTRLLSCRVVRGRRWDALSDHSPVVAEVWRP